MPRHDGASNYHAGALSFRTRKSRKMRGRKKQSQKDKAKARGVSVGAA